MKEYGYIENGYLRSQIIESYTQRIRNKDGQLTTVTISIEEQIQSLPSFWKPVDSIDNSMMLVEEDYVIVPEPYDAGDRISFHYIKKFDKKKIKKEIQSCKDALTASDYKVIKCYENFMLNQPLPYDLSKISIERQSLRDKINDLEIKLLSNA